VISVARVGEQSEVEGTSGGRVTLRTVLIFAAVAEALTGLALLIVPSLVARLLLGEDLSGVAIAVGRVTGIALIGLAVACWPGPPLAGMAAYSVLVTVYLAYLGLAGTAGILLWPAVALHLIVSIALGRALLRTGSAQADRPRSWFHLR
jgi:hypothetical protein